MESKTKRWKLREINFIEPILGKDKDTPSLYQQSTPSFLQNCKTLNIWSFLWFQEKIFRALFGFTIFLVTLLSRNLCEKRVNLTHTVEISGNLREINLKLLGDLKYCFHVKYEWQKNSSISTLWPPLPSK